MRTLLSSLDEQVVLAENAGRPHPTSFVPERPITREQEDALDRREFVQRLARSLIDQGTGKATGVVVGVTGPWGSGKSSILNLLHLHIRSDEQYPGAVIVRFDPWLVSGRDDLIIQFFSQLTATIGSTPSLTEKGEAVVDNILTYGARLAPVANYFLPGAGTATKSVVDLVKHVFAHRCPGSGLGELRVVSQHARLVVGAIRHGFGLR